VPVQFTAEGTELPVSATVFKCLLKDTNVSFWSHNIIWGILKKVNTGNILCPSLLIHWKFYTRSTTCGFDVKFVVRDVKLDFGFDPKPFWSFTGLRYLQNTGQYFLSLRVHPVRYSILWTIPCSRGILEKLTVPHLAKNLPSFYGRSIAAFTTAFHLSVSWARSIQSMSQTNFLEFELNIILPSNRWSSKSFLSLRFPQQNPICTSSSFMLHISPISFFFIWWVQFVKLFIIQYNLTKIILQSVADHNCALRSTAVCFASAVTEATNMTFHWLITFHPNLTFYRHSFKQIQ